jgi:DNA-binding NarL/FixJ family response regulator
VVFSEARNAADALSQIQQEEWNIVILDLSLPDRSGLEVLKDIKATKPKLPVLILSMHPEDQYALRVIKAGASGYLTKDSAPDQLLNAVQRILNGGKYVSEALSEQLFLYMQKPSKAEGHLQLSDREYQVLISIASGKTVSQIADHLSLSVKTISTYRTRILEKLHLSTSAELTHYVIENKLS